MRFSANTLAIFAAAATTTAAVVASSSSKNDGDRNKGKRAALGGGNGGLKNRALMASTISRERASSSSSPSRKSSNNNLGLNVANKLKNLRETIDCDPSLEESSNKLRNTVNRHRKEEEEENHLRLRKGGAHHHNDEEDYVGVLSGKANLGGSTVCGVGRYCERVTGSELGGRCIDIRSSSSSASTSQNNGNRRRSRRRSLQEATPTFNPTTFNPTTFLPTTFLPTTADPTYSPTNTFQPTYRPTTMIEQDVVEAEAVTTTTVLETVEVESSFTEGNEVVAQEQEQQEQPVVVEEVEEEVFVDSVVVEEIPTPLEAVNTEVAAAVPDMSAFVDNTNPVVDIPPPPPPPVETTDNLVLPEEDPSAAVLPATMTEIKSKMEQMQYACDFGSLAGYDCVCDLNPVTYAGTAMCAAPFVCRQSTSICDVPVSECYSTTYTIEFGGTNNQQGYWNKETCIEFNSPYKQTICYKNNYQDYGTFMSPQCGIHIDNSTCNSCEVYRYNSTNCYIFDCSNTEPTVGIGSNNLNNNVVDHGGDKIFGSSSSSSIRVEALDGTKFSGIGNTCDFPAHTVSLYLETYGCPSCNICGEGYEYQSATVDGGASGNLINIHDTWYECSYVDLVSREGFFTSESCAYFTTKAKTSCNCVPIFDGSNSNNNNNDNNVDNNIEVNNDEIDVDVEGTIDEEEIDVEVDVEADVEGETTTDEEEEIDVEIDVEGGDTTTGDVVDDIDVIVDGEVVSDEDNGGDNVVPPPPIVNDASCGAHPQCVGLDGDCCPSPEGVMLGCCTPWREPEGGDAENDNDNNNNTGGDIIDGEEESVVIIEEDQQEEVVLTAVPSATPTVSAKPSATAVVVPQPEVPEEEDAVNIVPVTPSPTVTPPVVNDPNNNQGESNNSNQCNICPLDTLIIPDGFISMPSSVSSNTEETTETEIVTCAEADTVGKSGSIINKELCQAIQREASGPCCGIVVEEVPPTVEEEEEEVTTPGNDAEAAPSPSMAKETFYPTATEYNDDVEKEEEEVAVEDAEIIEDEINNDYCKPCGDDSGKIISEDLYDVEVSVPTQGFFSCLELKKLAKDGTLDFNGICSLVQSSVQSPCCVADGQTFAPSQPLAISKLEGEIDDSSSFSIITAARSATTAAAVLVAAVLVVGTEFIF